MRRGKTRMFDRELQKASRFEDAVGFTENPAGFRNIHETHKADGKIKPGIGEWKLDRARDPVVYPQRFFFFRLLRVLDKDFRNIDRCHARHGRREALYCSPHRSQYPIPRGHQLPAEAREKLVY